jgi:uncharacterized membrane protein YccC
MPPEITLFCLVLLILAVVCLPVPPKRVSVRRDQHWYGSE